MKFFGEVGREAGNKELDFGGDPDSFVVDPGSFNRVFFMLH